MTKPVAYNAAANVVQMVAGIGLAIAFYRYVSSSLGMATLGVWSVVLATASASRLADLGLNASVTRFVARYLAFKEPQTAAQVVETTLLTLILFLGLALPVMYWPLMQLLPHLFEGRSLNEAREILPYAMFAMYLTMLASVVQSGLDGLQRMDLRALLALTGQMLMLFLAFVLVPTKGLIGLAWAQVGQATFLLVAGWMMLRHRLPSLHLLPKHWSRPLFKEMFAYGVNVQTASLFMLLFDPLTKVLMARYGGLEWAGYYEMANQVVLKIRSLIVVANQAVVPRVAQIAEIAPQRLVEMYRQNMRILIFILLPTFALLYACSGGISWLLTGQVQPHLVLLMQISAAGYAFNTLTVPAYFINMGSGKISLNTLSHVAMGFLNGALGSLLGQAAGAAGVASGFMIALVVGSWGFLFLSHKQCGISLSQLKLTEHRELALVCLATAAAGHFVWNPAGRAHDYHNVAALIVLMLVLAAMVWRHRLRSELWQRLAPKFL